MNKNETIEKKKSVEEPDYDEEFKIITYPNVAENYYLISNYGKVKRIYDNKFLYGYLDEDLHERITIKTLEMNDEGKIKSKHFFVHRLVAWEFIGPPPDEKRIIINHKDGIPYNNNFHNLEWCTVLENTNHAKKNNLMNNSGINSSSCKYKEKFIRKICDMLEDGKTPPEILEILLTKNKIKEYESEKTLSLIYKLHKKVIFYDICSEYDYKSSIPLIPKSNEEFIIRKMIYENKNNYEILKFFGYEEINDMCKKLYNRIIYQRSVCKTLFNDYRKDELEKAFG